MWSFAFEGIIILSVACRNPKWHVYFVITLKKIDFGEKLKGSCSKELDLQLTFKHVFN